MDLSVGGLTAWVWWISLEDVQIAQQMHRRFITLMCALGPSLTEAHAGTLLLLRSDGPLYNCTRATALWLSSWGGWGGGELPKGNVRHCHNRHNLE